MANTCQLDTKFCNGEVTAKYSDESWQERFNVKLDAPLRVGHLICNAARAANPTQFPLRGQSWPAAPTYGLFAKKFKLDPLDDLHYLWQITVTYLPLSPGEQNPEAGNPLLWPATYTIEWLEYEEAITKAKNVEAFTGPGQFNRPALTLGLCTNSAGGEFEEGVFETFRDAVLCIHKNVASLDQVLAVEAAYAKTTNSDTVYGIGPRRYKYIGVESGGQQTAEGVNYYQRTIRVQVMKTADKVVNNIGWHFVTAAGKKGKCKVADIDNDGNVILVDGKPALIDPAEPLFLTLGGARSDEPVSVSYRYLTEVPYAPLLL